MDKLIELTQVTAGYDRKIVLKDVSLTVWEHDFLGIIGPNGGGKTTLLKVILTRANLWMVSRLVIYPR